MNTIVVELPELDARERLARQARHLGHHQPVITHHWKEGRHHMRIGRFSLATRHLAITCAVVAVSLTAAGCSDDNTNGPATARMYNQVQRLGNPL